MSTMTSTAGAGSYPEFPKWICQCYRWGLKFQCISENPTAVCPKRWNEMRHIGSRHDGQ